MRKALELPNGLVVSGSAVGAGVVCTLSPSPILASLKGYLQPENYLEVNGFLIMLDASAVATANLTVSVNLLDFATGLYVTPATIWGPAAAGVTNPVVLTLATVQMVSIPFHWPSVQINIASFGTSTGTFSAMIQGY